jgi:hypothetical protein
MADGGLVDEATPALSALGNIGQAMREMLLLFEDRDQAKQLVASFPAPWLDAARQHQRQVAAGLAAPPAPQEVLSVLLADARWQWGGPEAMTMRLQSVTVKAATACFLHPVHLARAQKHERYISAAVQPQRVPGQVMERRQAQLMTTLAAIWKWRLPNQHKEVLWRLTVNGIAGARSGTSWLCGCGQHPPDMRDHCFWNCIVAHTVVDQVQEVVETFAPAAEVRRTNVWLFHPPPGLDCHITVWRGVSLAILNAMDRGRRVLAKALLTWRQGQQDRAQQPGIALHATWIQAACGRAVQCYWQEMAAFVHYLNACEPGKGPDLGANHPFIRETGMYRDAGRAMYELTAPPPDATDSDSSSSQGGL